MGESGWQLKLGDEHERLFDREVRQQTVVLSHVRRTAAHHGARALVVVEVDVTVHEAAALRPARDHVQ